MRLATYAPPSATSLATLESTGKGRAVARVTGILLLLLVLPFLPVAAHRFTLAPMVVAALGAMSIVASLATCVVLYSQFLTQKSLALLILADTYLYAAMLTACFLISVGIATNGGVLPAQLHQGTLFLWVCGHFGKSFGLGIYTLSAHRFSVRIKHTSRALIVGLATTIASVGLNAWMASTNFPSYILSGTEHASNLHNSPAAYLLIVVSVAAFAKMVFLLRGKTVLNLWAGATALALVLVDVVAIAGGSGGTEGWAVARVADVWASTLVLVAVLAEVSRLYSQLDKLARRDTVTGMANRAVFLDQVALSAEERGRSAVLFMDLNKFKAVNDTLGHEAGDKLLALVGRRLATCVRDRDLLARLGGDEFGVVLTNADEVAVSRVCLAMQEKLREPFSLGSHRVEVGLAVGAAVMPDDTRDPVEALRFADIAMYKSKNEGTPYCMASSLRKEEKKAT